MVYESISVERHAAWEWHHVSYITLFAYRKGVGGKRRKPHRRLKPFIGSMFMAVAALIAKRNAKLEVDITSL